mmetsp:Transcript_74156/g.234212  ORF Transcript_74156/g.234212 Transcript_74156/m.234212 type:complete len:281 (+) Transcript_74156:63-905(+)
MAVMRHTAFVSVMHVVLFLAAGCALLVHAAEQSCKAQAGKDHSLLQLQAAEKARLQRRAAPTCSAGDWVPCPGGGSCAGNQCCPNGEVCPSAELHWKDCAKPKSVDCLPSYQQPCEVGAVVMCPGTNQPCSGNQCCPGEHGSTVCPSAEYDFHDCQHPTLFDCTQPKCEVGAKVPCVPGSNPHEFCSGNQCCHGANGTFACPSADRDWDGCEKAKAHDCLEPEPEPCEVGEVVLCPGSDEHCAGNQCCHGVGGDRSSVCPSAAPGWSQCDLPKKFDCVSA